MIKRWTRLPLAVVAGFWFFVPATPGFSAQPSSPIQAAVETLESSALRLEVSSSPYSYRIIERSTGEVLLSQTSSAFRFEDELYPVADVLEITKSAGSLRATLSVQLSGRADLPTGVLPKAQVTFTFVKPEVVQVVLSYLGGSPREVSEEFLDRGEHYYGIWEYPFGGNIDDRGADREFLGARPQRNVNYSNGRAPFYVTSKKYG